MEYIKERVSYIKICLGVGFKKEKKTITEKMNIRSNYFII